MSTNPPDHTVNAANLLIYLRQLRSDRGAMADLRCALSSAQHVRAWPLLARVGGIGRPIYETVSGLYAYHPEETRDGNIGATCFRLKEYYTFDGRFRRLLTCDREELCERLRPIILAAKVKGIPINYETLFVDLCYWGNTVKVRWAREYWGSSAQEEVSTKPAEGVIL